jgi:hypothetical protein
MSYLKENDVIPSLLSKSMNCDVFSDKTDRTEPKGNGLQSRIGGSKSFSEIHTPLCYHNIMQMEHLYKLNSNTRSHINNISVSLGEYKVLTFWKPPKALTFFHKQQFVPKLFSTINCTIISCCKFIPLSFQLLQINSSLKHYKL